MYNRRIKAFGLAFCYPFFFLVTPNMLDFGLNVPPRGTVALDPPISQGTDPSTWIS